MAEDNPEYRLLQNDLSKKGKINLRKWAQNRGFTTGAADAASRRLIKEGQAKLKGRFMLLYAGEGTVYAEEDSVAKRSEKNKKSKGEDPLMMESCEMHERIIRTLNMDMTKLKEKLSTMEAARIAQQERMNQLRKETTAAMEMAAETESRANRMAKELDAARLDASFYKEQCSKVACTEEEIDLLKGKIRDLEHERELLLEQLESAEAALPKGGGDEALVKKVKEQQAEITYLEEQVEQVKAAKMGSSDLDAIKSMTDFGFSTSQQQKAYKKYLNKKMGIDLDALLTD